MSDSHSLAVSIREVGPEAAADVLAVIRAAFAGRAPLDPPTDALAETEESVAALLATMGGLVAELDGRVVAAVILDPLDTAVFLRRFGVVPDVQSHGVAHRLVAASIEAIGRRGGHARVVVLAREELPRTVGFWRDVGFTEVGHHTPYVELAYLVPTVHEVATGEDMQELGRQVATKLRAGDVLVLSGGLGAGKTTFTQGLGEGLGVRGGVTSPTFVISRVHPSLTDGPALVHVDAYRLGGAAELDDLDLDTDLDEAVTVVEWGEGLAESLADSVLHIRIDRSAAEPERPGETIDPRVVTVRGSGPRWVH